MRIARIRYNANYFGKEGYIIELKSENDSDYDFMSFFPLVKRFDATPDEERNFVHFSIINRIGELLAQGYEVIFR